MDSKWIRSLSAGAIVVALSLLAPSGARAQQRSGVEIWEAQCGRCHIIQPTDKYYPKDWRSVGMHMAVQARLTTAQREAVIAFLVSGARTDETAALPVTSKPTNSPAESVALTEQQMAQLEAYLRGLLNGDTFPAAPDD
jgi:hypothetical protein